MTTPYTSLQQNDDFGLTFSDKNYIAFPVLGVDTPLTISGAAPRWKAVIKDSTPTGNRMLVSLNAPVITPAIGSFIEGNSELVPADVSMCREVKAGDVLHFLSGGASSIVTVSLYSI